MGSKILTYTPDKIRRLARNVSDAYLKNLTQMLVFEDWKINAMRILYENPKMFDVQPVDYSKPIKICRSSKELLDISAAHKAEYDDIKLNARNEQKDMLITRLSKEIFTPKITINRPEGFSIDGKTRSGEVVKVPIWFNSTLKGINIRCGYANMDSATPGALRLDDTVVHAMLGGKTGSGKSVALNTVICSGFLEYPPWELEFYLLDMKIVELIRYANRIKSTHVSMVGATGSTEFVMSAITKLKDEMNMRQAVFEICGVSNIKDFREKYGLVMPRIILLVDEFVQLYENLKDAAQQGCTDTDEQKEAINSSISAISRLGRSMGIHMLLSSQSLDGTLDDQTANQFSGGISLAASASVSNALIGNDAGVRLTGKGKGIVNQNKMAKDESLNVYMRIPYICSEISEVDAAAGKMPYLQELLYDLRKVADEVGWDNELYTYNERDIIPYALMNEDLQYAAERERSPNTGNHITDNLFLNEITKVIVLGRPVKYSTVGVAVIDLKIRQRNSILVAAQNVSDRDYMLSLLIENLRITNFRHYVVAADRAITDITQVGTRLQNVNILRAKTFPSVVYNLYKNRKSILDAYTYMQDNTSGVWDSEKMVARALGGIEQVRSCIPVITEIFDRAISGNELTAGSNEELLNAGVGDYYLDRVRSALSVLSSLYGGLKNVTHDFTREFSAKDFSRVFVWFMGIDEQTDITDSEMMKIYRTFIADGPVVGIHSIITAEHWDRVGSFAESCSFICEKCQKSFFSDCSLPIRVNINANSFQVIFQETKSNEIIRKYNIQ